MPETLPLPEDVAELLLAWRHLTPYREAGDWVFAWPHTGGKRPYWPNQLMKDHIQPIAVRAGFGKVGWHSVRRCCQRLGQGSRTQPLAAETVAAR
jgi:integrase